MFTPMNPKTIIETTLRNRGGNFTFDGDVVSFTQGYMVAAEGYEHVCTLHDFKKGSIVTQYMQYVREHVEYGTYPEDTYNPVKNGFVIGTWMHQGKVYLDVSQNVGPNYLWATEEEWLNIALETARERNQLAIWDCKNNCEISVEG